jgi:hypothetical protein
MRSRQLRQTDRQTGEDIAPCCLVARDWRFRGASVASTEGRLRWRSKCVCLKEMRCENVNWVQLEPDVASWERSNKPSGLIKPLKPKFIWIIFKKSVCTSKRTPHFTITKINWMSLFMEVIAVYSEDYITLINTALQSVKIAGTYNYHYSDPFSWT